jgi:hypothetical protein
MKSSARVGTSIAVVLTSSLLGFGCSKKTPECQTVISSMNQLGAKLTETQKVTGNNDSKPEQVAAALRPFAATAKATGDALANAQLTVPEIKKIGAEASAASLALAASSSKMADAVDQMKGLDAAGKAVDDQKKLVDTAEAEIKKICEAKAAQCVELAKVLGKFPAPPEKSENIQATVAWTAKLGAWAAELAKVEIKNPELKSQVTAFDNGWKSFGAAMSMLVGITETAKKYEDFAKTFNAQIDAANKAIGDANAFCKG